MQNQPLLYTIFIYAYITTYPFLSILTDYQGSIISSDELLISLTTKIGASLAGAVIKADGSSEYLMKIVAHFVYVYE